MSDTADVTTVELPDEISAELKDIVSTTKRGFDPAARMRNRGLRRATITLFLNEEMGPKLGWAHDLSNGLGNVVGREREGVIGEIDKLEADRDHIVSQHTALNAIAGGKKTAKPDTKQVDIEIAKLTVERDKLIEEMNATALIIKMRAVPPVIQKDCRRKAKALLKITSKNIPEEMQEAFQETHAAFLMSVLFESVTDTESGGVIEATTYEDAIEYIKYLPSGQYERLDIAMGKVQYTDAISREIEGQEDFS